MGKDSGQWAGGGWTRRPKTCGRRGRKGADGGRDEARRASKEIRKVSEELKPVRQHEHSQEDVEIWKSSGRFFRDTLVNTR